MKHRYDQNVARSPAIIIALIIAAIVGGGLFALKSPTGVYAGETAYEAGLQVALDYRFACYGGTDDNGVVHKAFLARATCAPIYAQIQQVVSQTDVAYQVVKGHEAALPLGALAALTTAVATLQAELASTGANAVAAQMGT